MPYADSVTESGIVPTRWPSLAYTVTVWRYIMFCAKTSPWPVALTDLGEMAPRIVLARVSRRVSECGAGLAGVAVVPAAGAVLLPGSACGEIAWAAGVVGATAGAVGVAAAAAAAEALMAERTVAAVSTPWLSEQALRPRAS